MRVVVYNQMFGLDGRSFIKNVKGHYYLHYQKNTKKVFSRINLNSTFEIIGKSQADIAGICEIYEGQEDEIERGLKKLGYKYFYFGKGHRFRLNNLHVVELIASKIKGRQLDYKIWPVENRLGGGGGFVVCKFKDFSVIHVHLALPSRGFFKEQIEYLQRIVKDTDGKIIFMGDFNLSYQALKNYFPRFELVSGETRTCSITPIINWFYNKDVDHIFVKGFSSRNMGTLLGRSDHKLIYVDLD